MTQLNSLGLGKPPETTRVVVAMSGGVDSSAVAAMLSAEGYEVVGITLQLYDHGAATGQTAGRTSRAGACCAGRDIADARRVAETMGFPHYVLDYESRFRAAVIDDFADRYLAGATPVPCIRCNQSVKFRDLLDTARELGADCLATGHYIQRREGRAGPELHRAADPARDQSYFLFATTREQLDFLRFPLGHLRSKAETRALAARFGLAVAEKPDSQDICFVPQGGYAATIEKLRPGAAEPGEIVDLAGRVLGRHAGIIRFTVGQRRGLGLSGGLSGGLPGGASGGEPLYVVRLEADSRRVVVGPRAALATCTVRVGEVNWLGDGAFGDAPADGHEALVKVRSTRPPVPARIRPMRARPAAPGAAERPASEDPDGAEVELVTPEEGVAPGQACVFYAPDGSRVLGGGWIRPS